MSVKTEVFINQFVLALFYEFCLFIIIAHLVITQSGNGLKQQSSFKFCKKENSSKKGQDLEQEGRLCAVCATGALPRLGVKVRNMKMDFNTEGTWRRVGQ